jgi:homoserine dehydrogenase
MLLLMNRPDPYDAEGMGEVVRIGMLGCGNVGAAVIRMLAENAEEIGRRAGSSIEVTRVAVRDVGKARDVPAPASLFTDRADEVVRDPDVDVIVEVMGGVEPARTLIVEALRSGKPVVTANKELLATRSNELFEAAVAGGADLLYEAAVGGGIPLIRPLREHLAGDRITRFMGIVNGTTNYILTRMAEDGWTLPQALTEAQRLGYAEADPSADLEGHDAAAKAAILASIAFDVRVGADDVFREGILTITPEDIRYAAQMGYVIKLLAIAEADKEGVSVRVHPAMIPTSHPLASVRESFNAVYIEGERVGPLMLYGRGAGGDPTATSVVGDVIELARARAGAVRRGLGSMVGHAAHPLPSEGTSRSIRPIEDVDGQYYVLMRVADRPGVLAAIALVFTDHLVSIKSVWQEGHGEEAQLVLITHLARERALQACVRDLRIIDTVEAVGSVIRVVNGESEPLPGLRTR